MAEILQVRRTDSVLDETRTVQDQIMNRAYEIFRDNGGSSGRDLDHWLQAERELIWKPSVILREKGNELRLDITAPGIEPKDINIEVSPEDILIRAAVRHEYEKDNGVVHICEFESGRIFRSIHLPKRINPNKVRAEFRNGMLKVTAEVAADSRWNHPARQAA